MIILLQNFMNERTFRFLMSLIFYDNFSDDSSDKEFLEMFYSDKHKPMNGLGISNSELNKLPAELPPPIKEFVPPPPKPIEITPPQIAKQIIEAKNEKEQVVEIDFGKFKEQNVDVAKQNKLVRDRTVYNGVGYARAKSQLTYLANLDLETRQEYEEHVKKSTRAKNAVKTMYGW